MVRKYYEEFCFLRNRRARIVAQIDEDYSENNISADDYCQLYGNLPFKSAKTSFSMDVDSKPIPLLKSDIEIAYKDYLSYQSYCQYYEYWLSLKSNGGKSNFIEDFIDTNSFTNYIDNNRKVFTEKILSITNYFVYLKGFDDLGWLIEFLNELLLETISEIKRVEIDLRNFKSDSLNSVLKKVFIDSNLDNLEQETFIYFYFKMSSFDTCRKATSYLNNIVDYVKKVNTAIPNQVSLPETASQAIDKARETYQSLGNGNGINFVLSKAHDMSLIKEQEKEKNSESFEMMFTEAYNAYIGQILSMLTAFGYVNGNLWQHRYKYVARIIYDEFVKLGVMNYLGDAKAARCFISKFSNIKKSSFVGRKGDKIKDGKRSEVIEKVKSDLLIIYSRIKRK